MNHRYFLKTMLALSFCYISNPSFTRAVQPPGEPYFCCGGTPGNGVIPPILGSDCWKCPTNYYPNKCYSYMGTVIKGYPQCQCSGAANRSYLCPPVEGQEKVSSPRN